jgi:hypothetical protein
VEQVMPLHAQMGYWQGYRERQADRTTARIPASIRKLGVAGQSVILHDISTHGFQVDVDPPLPPGTFVWLRFAGTNGLNACVVWNHGSRHGCEFLVPIDGPLYEAALSLSEKG